MRKKILICAGYYYPYKGGYVESLQGLIDNLLQEGMEIDLITANVFNYPEFENKGNFRIFRLPGIHLLKGTYPMVKLNFQAFRMLNELRKENYDLVITNTRFFASSLLGLILAKIKRIPYFHIERGALHSVVSNKLINFLSHFYDHTLGWMVVKFAKYNIGVSKAACEFLKHLGAKNIEYIPNGIDILCLEKSPEEFRKKWRVDKKNLIITYAGRLIYAKGVQDLIEAVNKIDRPFKLLIAGEGNYRLDLEKLVNKFNLTAKVKFLGELNHDEVMEILRVSDVFVNPSYSEGLPRSVLEACAMSVPVIATDVGGTRELVINNKTGILTQARVISDLVAALKKMIRSANSRQELGKSAQTHVKENFSWGKIVQKYKNLFDKINA